MPTNLLRKRGKPAKDVSASSGQAVRVAGRRITICAGKVAIRAELLETPTAARIWKALPLYSTAERWGQALHFETPLDFGLEGKGVIRPAPSDVCFWCSEDRILIVFGPTPVGRGRDSRAPSPCNVWATALDDTSLLNTVAAGEKVSVTAD